MIENVFMITVTIISKALMIAAFSYLIGSIPTGYLIVKSKTGQDIREIGSGSTGATNVKRVLGKKWFFIVMLLDAIKGAIPVIFFRFAVQHGIISPDLFNLSPVIAAIFVIIGHSKSVFLNFKGGKSVASGVGTIIALNWQVGLILAVIWSIITFVTRYVSVGSIIALLLSPFFMFCFDAPVSYIAYCAIAAIYVIYLHRENIQRLIKGEENKVR
ncbi:MAG: glycerol-3-phosphate 1-O-acyltransferase PlsY [Candidatus Gastranaerophilales bacterium]|nr:glycerol-3-phosphate 1-O-acyltransferase PlsY [Candidatus Gastranaerophilales bacterium]